MIVRIGIVLIFLPFMAWVALRRIWIEARSIPFYIWCDWQDDFASIVPVWRKGRIDPEDYDGNF